jgi:hypothetical protein
MEQPEPELQDRGEFIAIQLELADGLMFGSRRKSLEQRQHELLTRYYAEWTLLVRQTGIPRRCIFRRGMIEGIQCDAQVFLREVHQKELFARAPITELILHKVAPADASNLAHCSALRQIHTLSIAWTVLEDVLAHLLLRSTHLTGLRRLILDGNPIRCTAGIGSLADWSGLRQLTELSLRRCNLGPADVQALLQSRFLDPTRYTVHLQRLDLRSNREFDYSAARLVLTRLEGHFSERRFEFVRGLLAPVERTVRKETFESLAKGLGAQATSMLLTGLHGSRHDIRTLSARLLDGQKLLPADLPFLLRRFYEAGMSRSLRSPLRALRFRVSSLVGTWLDLFLESKDAVVSLEHALTNETLPRPVLDEFVILCRRRLTWRAGHGRAVMPQDIPDRVEDHRALLSLIAIVARMAEDAAVRHIDPVHRTQKEKRVRHVARTKEHAWLAYWLARLLCQYDAQDRRPSRA